MWFPVTLRHQTHSATPVRRPNMSSGSSHSLDAPNTYPRIASAQQEPTVPKAIDTDSGRLSEDEAETLSGASGGRVAPFQQFNLLRDAVMLRNSPTALLCL